MLILLQISHFICTIYLQISIPLEDDEIRDATNEFMRKLVKQQMGTRLLNLVDELANAYGQGV